MEPWNDTYNLNYILLRERNQFENAMGFIIQTTCYSRKGKTIGRVRDYLLPGFPWQGGRGIVESRTREFYSSETIRYGNGEAWHYIFVKPTEQYHPE